MSLPPPRDWQVFEDLCWDLWRLIWNDPGAQKYGRQGHEQHGVDVIGRRAGGGVEGVQCKQKMPGRQITAAEIEREVAKARQFKPGLTRWILATTAPRDPKVQNLVLELNEGQDDFAVHVFAWDDIEQELQAYPQLIRKYFLTYVERADSPSGVLAVPDLPPHYLPRPEALEPLTRLLRRESGKVGVTDYGKLGLHGMGGIGKSVLVAAAVRHPEVEGTFTDGVLWITLGATPNLVRLQQELAEALGEIQVLRSPHQGKRILKEVLADRAVLLVLDDVWDLKHAAMLDVVGAEGRLLLTTRNREILAGLGARELEVDVLSPGQARLLLAEWSGTSETELPARADEVAEACGFLPLALAMIGGMVRLEPTAWDEALAHLEEADLEKIEQAFPDYPYPDLLRALDVSVQALDANERARYVELAVVPEDAAVPEAALEVLWRAKKGDVRRLMRRFVARSLARRDASGRLTLHDLQKDYVRHLTGETQTLHAQLVDAYADRCPKGLAEGADDGYFFEFLPYHLVESGHIETLRELLADFRWLRNKIRCTSVPALLGDYDHLPAADGLAVVSEALILAAPGLARHPEQLPSQLLGRLEGLDDRRVQGLLAGVASQVKGPWLRPLWTGLASPGGAFLRSLEGHSSPVTGVAVMADGRLVSSSLDHTLRVWDADSGEILKTFEGHLANVFGVAVMADGRLVSASGDGTLRVWDADSGETLQTLEGHTDQVMDVAVMADGRVISGSWDGTLRVWNADSGETLQTLEGHTRGVAGVAVLADGRVVSASYDTTLRVWDVDSGEALLTLAGHWAEVQDVAELADKLVVSASTDGTLQLWDADTGEAVQLLDGHSKEVSAVAALADGRVVSGSDDHTLRVWDAASGEPLRTLEGHSGSVNGVAVIGGGRIVSASFDRTLRLWDVDRRAARRALESHPKTVYAVAVRADGRVVSASADNTLRVWDAETGESLQTLKGHSVAVIGLAVLADGSVVSASYDQTLRVWDADRGEALQILRGHAGPVRAVAALADGRIVSASADGTLRVWDPETGETLRTLEGHAAPVTGVTALVDGRVASSSSDHTLRVWDPDSGKTHLTLEGDPATLISMQMLADGRVVSTLKGYALRLWDQESGQTLAEFEGHSEAVQEVTMLADGRVVSVSHDRTMRVWDSESGESQAVFVTEAPLWCVATAPANGRIAAGDGSGRLHYLSLDGA